MIQHWCSIRATNSETFYFCLSQAIDRFRGSQNGILIATDVAARGLDIPGVRTVVHYQLPHSAEVSRTQFTLFELFLYMCYLMFDLEVGLCS